MSNGVNGVHALGWEQQAALTHAGRAVSEMPVEPALCPGMYRGMKVRLERMEVNESLFPHMTAQGGDTILILGDFQALAG